MQAASIKNRKAENGNHPAGYDRLSICVQSTIAARHSEARNVESRHTQGTPLESKFSLARAMKLRTIRS